MPMSLGERAFKGNAVQTARAALRAQHLVMLLEDGVPMAEARQRLGITERTAKRYRLTWGSRST